MSKYETRRHEVTSGTTSEVGAVSTQHAGAKRLAFMDDDDDDENTCVRTPRRSRSQTYGACYPFRGIYSLSLIRHLYTYRRYAAPTYSRGVAFMWINWWPGRSLARSSALALTGRRSWSANLTVAGAAIAAGSLRPVVEWS